jgi:hypothetical protein
MIHSVVDNLEIELARLKSFSSRKRTSSSHREGNFTLGEKTGNTDNLRRNEVMWRH